MSAISAKGLNCPDDCAESYNESVTLTTNPGTGYSFSSWTGCDNPSGNACSMTMNANKSVTANFTQIQPTTYNLNVGISPSGSGSVAGSDISCPGTCSKSFISDSRIILTATPSTGYNFSSWNGCDSSSGNTCSVTMNAAKTITRDFCPEAQGRLE